MLWSQVWYGEDMAAKLTRTVLTPASWAYAGGWNAYAGLYRSGLKKAAEPHVPVVCVGNLTVGGSGKTPLVMHLAQVLTELGREVVISCSGYGSPASEDASIAPEGALKAGRWGDEPAMFRWLLPEVPLIVGRNRVTAAKLCRQSYPKAVMLMDDGFQHLPLKKHLTILLDPPSTNRRCLPAGPYREPASHIERADLVLPGHLHLSKSPLWFSRPDGKQTAQPSTNCDMLCAIGRPAQFESDLRSLGINIRNMKALPDHDPLSSPLLLGSDGPVIVTAKDWVKLREREDLANHEIVIARQDVTVEPKAEFGQWLSSKLHEIQPQRN